MCCLAFSDNYWLFGHVEILCAKRNENDENRVHGALPHTGIQTNKDYWCFKSHLITSLDDYKIVIGKNDVVFIAVKGL